MNPQIDLLKFQGFFGDPKWLPVVGGAFLQQLPQWHQDVQAARAAGHLRQQADLLHKIKGACHAVAACDMAGRIEQAEVLQARGQALPWPGLLAQLALVESELQAIVDGAAA